MRVTMWNFVKIGQTVAEICDFKVSQNGGPLHLGLSKIQIFAGLYLKLILEATWRTDAAAALPRRTQHDGDQSICLQKVSEYRDSTAPALQQSTGRQWSRSSVRPVSNGSTTIHWSPVTAVKCPACVYWISLQRSTQSTTNCCYLDSIARLGSEVKPTNGSSPTCRAGRTALYMAQEHHQLFKWPVLYRRVQF